MNKYLPFIIIASCFLLLKITNLGVRLSDTNIYFYTGHLLLQGKVLYKDIFFTNFPLFPYVSSLYVLLTGGNLPLYYLTSAIEAVVTGFLIYLIVFKQAKSSLLSALCSLLYLFSFMILSTTDHQTGVFLASLFAVASYYFYLEKKWLLTGILIALALLTKAYFIPIAATYVVMLFIRESGEGESQKKDTSHPGRSHAADRISNKIDSIALLQNDNFRRFSYFSLGFLVTVLIILLPTFILAQSDFIRDVFTYSLTRSEGIPKGRILWFFITHDLLITASFIYALVMLRTYRFFGILSVFSILFILLYKDIYYLYLNFLLPFFCIAFANLYRDIEKRVPIQQLILPTIIGICIAVNLFIYLNGYRNLQRIDNIDSLVSAIQNTKPPYLYGSNGVTPALAYLTNTPLVNPTIDMNGNLFRKGFLNAKSLTRDALQKKAMFVGEGLDYPEYTTYQPITDEVVDIQQLQTKQCQLVQAVPIKSEGPQNRINIITCL